MRRLSFVLLVLAAVAVVPGCVSHSGAGHYIGSDAQNDRRIHAALSRALSELPNDVASTVAPLLSEEAIVLGARHRLAGAIFNFIPDYALSDANVISTFDSVAWCGVLPPNTYLKVLLEVQPWRASTIQVQLWCRCWRGWVGVGVLEYELSPEPQADMPEFPDPACAIR
jgi:hypothetical protein